MNKLFKNYDIVMEFANSTIEGRRVANKEQIQMCQRFMKDLDNTDYVFNPKDPEFVIQVIESTFVHQKGESIEGYPLRGTPFLLQPWQKFVIYNLLGFFHADKEGNQSKLRRFKESFCLLPRKQGKSPFMSALSWGLALLERKSSAEIIIVGEKLKQAMQSFNFLLFNLRNMGEDKNFRVLDNNQEHSISGDLADGYLRIETIAGNSDKMDSLNTLIQILDELHLYKSASHYNTIKESGKAYRNSLCIGITTAGDNPNSFCYNRMKYCQKILDGTVKDEQYFVFIAKADEDEDGDVDYTNPIEHEKANVNYNVSVSAQELMNDALQAQNDPQQRKSFLAKSLNIYTSSMNTYFNIEEFRASDKKYNWSLEELAKLPVDWYGGCDLAKLHDLCGSSLYGTYKDVDIAITHAFFPRPAAYQKADEDNIPLFGWLDDGHLTMTNSAVIDHQEIVRWFKKMREMGFNIKQVGFDPKFGREFFLNMKREKFRVEDTPQLHYLKSEGFRRIESKAKEGKFYYLHSDAYEYCLQNVKAVEKTDDAIQYEKVMPTQRIDLFDASVFSSMQMLKNLAKSGTASKWLGGS
ncbi:terminase large subunit [Halobacillus sp. A5]|uniref:terminase large subunit n=1 Tax=Halobacillus sp. A5 TaxID=2880263 RepID=UPI0020A62630|nr:terminase large subunit [Halobacillus sp. A5]MCP3025407.1 terminase large subunit [Halobacillus sp. A5]